MGRSLAMWAVAGAAITLGLWAIGVWIVETRSPFHWAWLIANILLNPSMIVGIAAFYEVPIARYGMRELAILAGTSALAYLALGWTAWMGRHRSSVFYVLSGAIMAPFVLAASFVLFELLRPG